VHCFCHLKVSRAAAHLSPRAGGGAQLPLIGFGWKPWIPRWSVESQFCGWFPAPHQYCASWSITVFFFYKPRFGALLFSRCWQRRMLEPASKLNSHGSLCLCLSLSVALSLSLSVCVCVCVCVPLNLLSQWRQWFCLELAFKFSDVYLVECCWIFSLINSSTSIFAKSKCIF
jgi:hypothetical protein